jgi:exodeoxyribonuclease VII large subunit
MAKKVKSQWDFGELFPPEQTRKVFSVTELTWQIREVLEQQVGSVWVTGEVTNLRIQSSGHIYFTLKDASAQLSCVLFRSELLVNRTLLEEGRALNVQGEVTVYEARGQYQIRVKEIEVGGVGVLQAAFEKLKQKLNAEGLFAPDRKRPLPRFPHCLGVVTSPTGAALRDVLHVIQRRQPALNIILAPCRVQGEGAAAEIAAAIRLLNEFNAWAQKPEAGYQPIDLVLVTRGGGSLEDLWAFNEEAVARAIFQSALPVVSAVGHEIDFTIGDFVADLRAATPSAAAEIITEGVYSSGPFVSDAVGRMGQLVRQEFEYKAEELTQLRQRLARVHPRRRFNDWLQRLDDLQTSVTRAARQGLRNCETARRSLAERLARVRPALFLRQRRDLLRQEAQRLREQFHYHLETKRNRLSALEARLRLLGPEQVLARGYSITTDARTGTVLHRASEATPGQRLKTRLKAGEVVSRVEG